ncbi:Plant Tudor-like RNA-binding protein [Forsythia ovata]|uniref:Plant Tudor-like RNA-binding protein n=1 Tax=Forsythia ovata TaxID=205694 RepID=A0ABD1WHY2_9LAMI
MRFKRGSKVEVMNKREAPVSWSTAEIVSDNGNTYSVRRYYYVGMACEPIVERVSRKLVRPYPPVVQVMENYVTGDIVEMFDNFSWKIANILKVLHGNQYLIKQFGSSQESIIPRSNIRVRQTWHDDKWIMMGKSCGRLEDGKVKESSALNCHKNKSFMGAQFNARDKIPQEDCINIQNYVGFQGSPVVSSRSRKRMFPYCSSIFEADTGNVQKIKAIEKEGQRRRIAVPILEKVDAVAYPRETLGEKHMHSSFKKKSNGYSEMERAKENDILAGSGVRSSEFNYSDSDICSVGSCSVASQSPNDFHSHFPPMQCLRTNFLFGDAESFNGSGSEKKSYLPPKEEVEARIHELEFHAYCSTLEAFYASGPLSWEQESLLANLRILLNISNDEHMMKLKYLISAKAGPPLDACTSCKLFLSSLLASREEPSLSEANREVHCKGLKTAKRKMKENIGRLREAYKKYIEEQIEDNLRTGDLGSD